MGYLPCKNCEILIIFRHFLAVAYRRPGHSGHALSLWIRGAHAEPPTEEKKNEISATADLISMICKSLIKMAIVSINMNGTTGSIPDVIQHMIVIRNLVRRLFVKKTAPSSR